MITKELTIHLKEIFYSFSLNQNLLADIFSSTSVLKLLSETFNSVPLSISTLVKLSRSMLLFVRNTRASELQKCILPEKVRTGSLVLPPDSEIAKLIITTGVGEHIE